MDGRGKAIVRTGHGGASTDGGHGLGDAIAPAASISAAVTEDAGMSSTEHTPSSDEWSYSEIVATAVIQQPPISLCELVHSANVSGGGIYVVESLQGALEQDLHPGGTVQGFTYVTLKPIDPWFGKEQGPKVARIFGGPRADDSSGGWDVSLRVGERIGVVFTKATPENRNYPYMSPSGTFTKRADGGYTNGELYTERDVSEAELSELVHAALASDCTS